MSETRVFLETPEDGGKASGLEWILMGLTAYYPGQVTVVSGFEVRTESAEVQDALMALFGRLDAAQPGATHETTCIAPVSRDEALMAAQDMPAQQAAEFLKAAGAFVESVAAPQPYEPAPVGMVQPGATALELAEASEIQVCAICHSTYEGRGFGRDGRYCSKKCQTKSYNDKYKAKVMQEQKDVEGMEAELRQVLQWRIASSGKEISDPTALLRSGKLAVGERLHKVDGRVYEVVQRESGELKLRKVYDDRQEGAPQESQEVQG